MKVFKRNAVIITVLLFVCVAVYLNWSYNSSSEDTGTVANVTDGAADDASAVTDEAGSEEAGLYYEEDSAVSDYFATVRLSRQQARDEATETLSAVTEAEGASQETVDEALAAISDMARYAVTEAELESLIISKGFDECVVFITGSTEEDTINVTVPSTGDGLSTAAVARIKDVVINETDFTADQIRIVEISAE